MLVLETTPSVLIIFLRAIRCKLWRCPWLQIHPQGVGHRTLNQVLSWCQSSWGWARPTRLSFCPLWLWGTRCPDLPKCGDHVYPGGKCMGTTQGGTVFSAITCLFSPTIPVLWVSASSLFLTTYSLAVTQQVLTGASCTRCCRGKNNRSGYSFQTTECRACSDKGIFVLHLASSNSLGDSVWKPRCWNLGYLGFLWE